MLNKDICYLCGSKELKIIHYGTRGNDKINVLKCTKCGLVQLDDILFDADKFYAESGMRKNQPQDINTIRNAAETDDTRRFYMAKNQITNKRVLDFGCGAGGFLKKAKLVAKEVSGIEIEAVMRNQINSEGIQCYQSLEKALIEKNKFDFISFFHVIEHLPDPISTLGGYMTC